MSRMTPSISKLIYVTQDIIDGISPDLPLTLSTIRIPEALIGDSDLLSIFDHSRPLGISPGYAEDGRLLGLAISDNVHCRIIEFKTAKRGERRRPAGGSSATDVAPGLKSLEEKILCRPAGDLLAFDMGPLALALYKDLRLSITSAIDIQSAYSAVDRKPLGAIRAAVGDDADSPYKMKVKVENIKNTFLYPVYDPDNNHTVIDLAVRAWVSQFLAIYGNGESVFEKAPRIDTRKLTAPHLQMISKLFNDSHRLDQKKPVQVAHQFQQSVNGADSQLQLKATHFNNRFRGDRKLRMEVDGQHGKFNVTGSLGGVSGRAANVVTTNNLTKNVITTVTSIGRDDPTTAEAQRAAAVLRILQGTDKLLDESPWIQNIWFPQDDEGSLTWPEEWSKESIAKPTRKQSLPPFQLNSSQRSAVNYMMSRQDKDRITLVQGPPGTGKTSVIAAFVHFSSILPQFGGVWLVAQSNVAVKNIAEKLAKTNFLEWKLLVSRDFIFQWHEHLYTKITDRIISSEEFISTSKASIRGTKVILCTLSMLSNKNLKKFTTEVPLKTLIIDEASQIEIGSYVPVFSNFKGSLRKVCFIGDDKQLPPHGQEDLKDLQSIFEVPHLSKHVKFLDTQYRMPPQIGTIISDLVYEGKLKSNPEHPVTSDTTACYFLDIPGKEKPLHTGSFMNTAECEAVLLLAEKLEEQGKGYRIITPYDGQRTHIETQMKEKGLKWEDKCFNVDSFQGNEEDFIIISVVRSRSLGFLKNLRRTNVMLTRCKLGMFIVSSLQFLQGPGAETLVGKLLKRMEPAVWLTPTDIEEGKF